MSSIVKDAISALYRHRWYFAIPFLFLTVLGTCFAVLLPATYRSEATILVESQQIPQDIVRATITSYSSERIAYITQRVLTRARILDVIEKFGLYSESKASFGENIDRFRSNVEIDQVSANIGRRQSTTISFSLSFVDRSPEVAQSVVNELVTMFLDENVRSRSERAEQTTDFLEQEGEKIRKEIILLESAIAEFKKNNGDRMPDVAEMNSSLMRRYESEYQNVVLEVQNAKAELKVLRLQLAQYQDGSTVGQGDLLDLKRRYRAFLVRNTENHPDAVRMRREIEALELSFESSQRTSSDEPLDEIDGRLLDDSRYARLASDIESANRKVEYFERTKQKLSIQLRDLELRIVDAPAVEQEFSDLQRDLANLDAKYQEIKDKQLEAQISENLEKDQKGERFRLLESANTPQGPETPNRLILLFGAYIFAIVFGFGMVALRELLSPGIRSFEKFSSLLGSQPLLTIPVFGDDMETISMAKQYVSSPALALTIVVSMLVVVMAVVHVAYAPLETLLVRGGLL